MRRLIALGAEFDEAADGSTGRRWLGARRPELYRPLTAKYGDELDSRTVRFSARCASAEPPCAG